MSLWQATRLGRVFCSVSFPNWHVSSFWFVLQLAHALTFRLTEPFPCWPVRPHIRSYPPDLSEHRRQCESDAWWERFKASSNASAVDNPTTPRPHRHHEGSGDWVDVWAVNTDLEPLPSLDIERLPTDCQTCLPMELQHQPHIYSKSCKNPSASQPNLAAQMADLEAYRTNTSAGTPDTTSCADADLASSEDWFPTPRPRVRADLDARATAAQMADLKARAADRRSLAAQMADLEMRTTAAQMANLKARATDTRTRAKDAKRMRAEADVETDSDVPMYIFT